MCALSPVPIHLKRFPRLALGKRESVQLTHSPAITQGQRGIRGRLSTFPAHLSQKLSAKGNYRCRLCFSLLPGTALTEAVEHPSIRLRSMHLATCGVSTTPHLQPLRSHA